MLALLKVPTMSTSKPARMVESVTVIRADVLAIELRMILVKLDQSAKYAESGNPDMHVWSRQAREDLHDLLAECQS